MENNGNKNSFNFVDKFEKYNKDDVFLAKGQRESILIKVSEIKLILADIQYSEIVLKDNTKITMRVSLNEWELKLPSEILVRVHKSTIVNFNFVKSKYTDAGKYYLIIDDLEEDIQISRRRCKLVMDYFNIL